MKFTKDTRFYKTEKNLMKGLEKFGFTGNWAPSLIVETPQGWTAVFNGIAMHGRNLQPIIIAHRGFVCI